MAAEDERNDVTKKRDLTDFYRNILSQRTEDIASSVAADSATNTATADQSTDIDEAAKQTTDINEATGQTTDMEESKTADPTPRKEEKTDAVSIKKLRTDKKRTYRARANLDLMKNQETGSEGSSEDSSDGEDDKTDDDNIASVKETEIVTKKDGPVDVDNPDRDDSNSSSSSEDENEEKATRASADENVGKETKETEADESETVKEKKSLYLSEAEKRELRINLVKESCKKRNTPETIQAAIERYWQRQAVATTS